MTKVFGHVVIASCFILQLVSVYICHPANLSSTWDKVIAKYPLPTNKERERLSDIYLNLFAQYPPGAIVFNANTISWKNRALYIERLRPYDDQIEEASLRFHVPKKIISAVILQESWGNSKAKSDKSSAKGLMQTIDDTFALAQNHLIKQGIFIKNPLIAKDSIMAGTWYLSYVFELAKQDFPRYNARENLAMWEKALEYYYAGPVWGKNPKAVLVATVNGKKITIKKQLYACSVLNYANNL